MRKVMGCSGFLMVCTLLAILAGSGAFPNRAQPELTEEKKVVSTVRRFNRTSQRTTSVRQDLGPDRVVSSVSRQEQSTSASGLRERSVSGLDGRLSHRRTLTEDVRRVRQDNGTQIDLVETVGAGRSRERSRSDLFGATNATLQLLVGTVNRSDAVLRADGARRGELVTADLLSANASRCDDCLSPAQLNVSVITIRPDDAVRGAEVGDPSDRELQLRPRGESAIDHSDRGTRAETPNRAFLLQTSGEDSALPEPASNRISEGPRARSHRTAHRASRARDEGARGSLEDSLQLGGTEPCREDCCPLTDIGTECTCYQIRLSSNACIVQHMHAQ